MLTSRASLFPGILTGAALVLAIASSARATSVPDMDLRALVDGSPSIVHGSVISTRCRWNEDRSLIVTDVRVRVMDAIRGGGVSEIEFTQPGGVVGKLVVEVPGASAFRSGDEAVFFLAPDAWGRLCLNGLSRGCFAVLPDPVTGQKTVRGLPLEGMTAAGWIGAAGPPGAAMGSVPLHRFLGDLRILVEDAVGGGGRK